MRSISYLAFSAPAAGDIGGAGGGGNGFRGVYDDEPDYGPTMPGPGATRKKKKKPIDPSQLDWQGQRSAPSACSITTTFAFSPPKKGFFPNLLHFLHAVN